MADGGGSKEDQWVLAPAERELVMTKNRANRLGSIEKTGNKAR